MCYYSVKVSGKSEIDKKNMRKNKVAGSEYYHVWWRSVIWYGTGNRFMNCVCQQDLLLRFFFIFLCQRNVFFELWSFYKEKYSHFLQHVLRLGVFVWVSYVSMKRVAQNVCCATGEVSAGGADSDRLLWPLPFRSNMYSGSLIVSVTKMWFVFVDVNVNTATPSPVSRQQRAMCAAAVRPRERMSGSELQGRRASRSSVCVGSSNNTVSVTW